jgi:hypothetical protein
MPADEKLAIGLTDRYFRDVESDCTSLTESVRALPLVTRNSLRAWEGAVQGLIFNNRKSLVTSWLELRKSRSIWWGAFFTRDYSSFSKRRDEDVLSVGYLRWHISSSRPSFLHLPVIEISSHAIRRVFMRSDVGYSHENGYDSKGVTSELKDVPQFATIWAIFLMNAPESTVVFPVIPTANGFFLCEAEKFQRRSGDRIELRTINARTYISTKEMSEDQKHLHVSMLEIYARIKNAPIFVAMAQLADPIHYPQYEQYFSLANYCCRYWLTRLKHCHGELIRRLLVPGDHIDGSPGRIGHSVLAEHLASQMLADQQCALVDQYSFTDETIAAYLSGSRSKV